MMSSLMTAFRFAHVLLKFNGFYAEERDAVHTFMPLNSSTATH